MTKLEELKRLGCVYLVSKEHFAIIAYRDIFGVGIAISNGLLTIQLGHFEFAFY